ncbi:MAG TPA: Ig-like domain-containing protein, partial [Archangium sp.]
TTSLSEGPHAVVAREQGSTNGSISVPFTVDSIAPSAPMVTSPTPNQYTSPTPTLAGTAEPGARVEVSVDGMAVCVTLADGAGAWRCVPPSALADGTHTVTAKATDVATNESLPSQPVTFQVDRTPPTPPVITAPAEGSSLTDTTPTFTGTAEPGSTVTVRVNGMTVCTATASAQGAWSCDAMAALPRGTHVATATATDPAGNTSMPSDSRSFTVVAETPPAPAITGPASGTITSDPTPRVTGTATPGSTVTVREAGTMTVLCTATADAQGNWSCDTSVLTDGTHGLVATAEKDGATSMPSSETTIRIDTTPPDVNVEGTPPEPIPSTTGTTFTWAIESDTTYECSIDGGAFQECTAPFNVPGLAPGEHTITVRATDAAGNVNETSTTWLVSDPAHVWDVTGGGLSCAAIPAESFAVLMLLLAMRRLRS